VVGNGGNVLALQTAYSADGKNWTTTSGPGGKLIAWGNNRFVLIDGDGKTAYSENGINWTQGSKSAFDEGDIITDIAWGGGKFVAVGYNLRY